MDPAIVALSALMFITAAGKFIFAARHPLTLDELWTGMIASQRSPAALFRQCYLDVNAPLGYILAWMWAHLAGLSDWALRFPSVVFASATPLLALTPNRAIPRQARLVWCALLACWIPGFVFAGEARSYALLLFLCTGATIAFLSLLREPSTRKAFVWASVSSVLILTHYTALPLVGCQGLAFLLAHRLGAFRTWPALLAFVPALTSLAIHAALLVGFSNHGPAGGAPLRVTEAPELLAYLVGGRSSVWVLLAWGAVTFALWRLRPNAVASPSEHAPSLVWLAPATSLAAVALCLGVSLAHPFITERYLTSMAPGVLLGIALIAQELGRRTLLAPIALAALQFGLVAGLLPSAFRPASGLNLEAAWSDLRLAGVQRLAFFWDSPMATGGNLDALAQVGGFLFHRDGRPLVVTALIVKSGEDPNPILALGNRRPGAGIVWLDPGADDSAARRFPPRIESLDPRWRCRDFGTVRTPALACVYAPSQ